MRINKYVARATGMARRKVDTLIESGQITVNNQPARIGQQITDGDEVMLAGKALSIPKYTYVSLNKPVGYVCSRQSQKGSQTVYDLLPSTYRSLKLVGRLDKASSGIILLTDDGDFAHTMLHPSFSKRKQYEVELSKALTTEDQKQIENGVTLEDGISQLEIVNNAGSKATVAMQEGRNRQIRRTFAALGYEVQKLHRTNFGDYSLDGLSSGEHKELDISK
jgi:23S rRNA pseudouridine2605 synthase